MEVLISRDMVTEQRLYILVVTATNCMANQLSNVFMEFGREELQCANVRTLLTVG